VHQVGNQLEAVICGSYLSHSFHLLCNSNGRELLLAEQVVNLP